MSSLVKAYVPSILGLLMFMMILEYKGYTVAGSQAHQVGIACTPSKGCHNRILKCHNTTCKLKRAQDCTDFRDLCLPPLYCIISCPCCTTTQYTCQWRPSMLESCPLTLMLLFAGWLGAALISALAFYLVLEKLGS